MSFLHPRFGRQDSRPHEELVWISLLTLIAVVELKHSQFSPILRRWIGVGTRARRRYPLATLLAGVAGWFVLHILTAPKEGS